MPAMGSHGGANAEGQKQVLAEYGITVDKVGAPIISSMEVVNIGDTESGIPVLIDRNAFEADHIIVFNRVKAHTEFHGTIESGLMKMMVIGLGKYQGACSAHKYAVKYGYEKTLLEIGSYILKKAPITMGIATIENGYNNIAQISAVDSSNLIEREKELLKYARSISPKLPFNELDVLVIDEAGKHISGTGMDTKVIGRIMNIYEPEVDCPKITRIILRDLSDKTHGNAIGVGLADFVTKKVAEKIDYRTTYINSITAVTPEKGRMPIVCENDKEALDFAIETSGPVSANNVRLAWIKNTSSLSEMYISEGLLAEIENDKRVEIMREAGEIRFDKGNNFLLGL